MEYRLEDDLLKKSRPRFGSKRYRRLYIAMGSGGGKPCEICGKFLLNPQSILIHQGGHCQSKIKQTNE